MNPTVVSISVRGVPVTTTYLPHNGDQVLVIAAGLHGEVNAEAILEASLAEFALTASSATPKVLWSTPAEFSVTGAPLLRRLLLDETTLEWGPNIAFTDAPEIHDAAVRCNAELLGAA